MEALSSASARGSGGGLRTFSGAFADVLGGEREPAQRDFRGERFGPGGDEVHTILREGLYSHGTDGAFRPPCTCPQESPLWL